MRALLNSVAGAAVLAAAPAHAEWRKFETAHFIIYSESNDKRVSELATRLENIDGLMRLATGLGANEEPVKVRIYEMADEGQVQAALGQTNTGVAGFYSSNILGPFAVTLRKAYSAEGDFTAELVLHHEYAHHFMLQYFPATYPPWYVEGFAELIGSSKILSDGRVAYGFPARHRRGFIGDVWVNVRDVLLTPPEKLHDFDLYGQGWAMTHFLTFSKERAPQLRNYLKALSAGKTPEQAAAAFGDLDKLNQEARNYLLGGQFEYRPVSVPIHTPVIQSVSALRPAEAALIPETIAYSDDDLASYRKDSDREKERRRRQALLQRIRTDASAYPNDPYALYMLALAENDFGAKDRALAAADRLLAVVPANARGLALKSMLISGAAASLSGAQRTAKASDARKLAIAANKSDPDDPLAYVAFYQAVRAGGEKMTAGALEGLIAAVQRLPANDAFRQMLVDEFAEEGRYAAAMAVLAPIANSPHESPLRQAAREKMARLQAAAAAQAKTTS